MPMRVTLNDVKKQTWFNDLADPSVPLYKLGKNIPHGAKGHDLLDLLHANGVTIPRAVWFLRVSGANETSGLRNKPSYNPLQYSIDWANIFLGYVKKQLNEIALPSAPRAGLNIKSSFKGILSDVDTRLRWASRFSYSLNLIRAFLEEGLLDRLSFLSWLVQQIGSSNLAQFSFILRLVDEYLTDICVSRALAKPVADACLAKYAEIVSTCPAALLAETRLLTMDILKRLCVRCPDALVSPITWKQYSEAFTAIFNNPDLTADVQHRLPRYALSASRFEKIKARNEALLCLPSDQLPATKISAVMKDVELLNSISYHTDMSNILFFPKDALQDPIVFSSKLDLLLSWSVTPMQYGDHRPFVAITLLKHFRDQASERASRRDVSSPDEFLQDCLFGWLDTSEVAGDIGQLREVALLFGKLVKYEIFSYAWYIQRLIARGEPGLSFSQDKTESRHRRYLRWIPLYDATSSLQSQRKVTLYGVRAREIPEDESERTIRGEIRNLLPEFTGTSPDHHITLSELQDQCQLLFKATRYEQVRIFRQWLLPLLQKFFERHSNDPPPSCLRLYSIGTELLIQSKCYRALYDFACCVLENKPGSELLSAVLDTIQRFVTILVTANAVSKAVRALYHAHCSLRDGSKSRPLMLLLMQLDGSRFLSFYERDQLLRDMADFSAGFPQDQSGESLPANIPEILFLATDEKPDAAFDLASILFLRYRGCVDWGWKVWDDTFASLRQLPTMYPDASPRRLVMTRYISFLEHVDKHLPAGLNQHVLKWLLGSGQAEINSLSAEAWDVVVPVLFELVLRSAIQCTTLLHGIIYPTWRAAASISSHDNTSTASGRNASVMRLSNAILCANFDALQGINSSINLFVAHRLCTQRKLVFRDSNFPLLVGGILSLVWIECNEHLEDDFRSQAASLREQISADRSFARGAYLHLDKLRALCETELRSAVEFGQTTVAQLIISTVGRVFGMPDFDLQDPDGLDLSPFTSPWKMTASHLLLRLILQSTQTSSQALNGLIERIWQAPPDIVSDFANHIRDAAPEIAQKCVFKGAIELFKAAQQLDPKGADYLSFHRRTWDGLRILAHMSHSLDMKNPGEGTFMAPVIQMIAEKLSSADPQTAHYCIHLGILSRLLGFALRFDTANATESLVILRDHLLQHILRLSERIEVDTVLVTMLLDTLCYVIDAISHLSNNADPFQPYPSLSPSEASVTAAPAEIQTRLRRLLPVTFTTNAVANLSYARIVGDVINLEGPVVNRPWEWSENLGEPSVPISMHQYPTSLHPLINAGSLSLESFGGKPVGEILVEEPGMGKIYSGHVSAFLDGAVSSNVWKQDWEESRLQNDRLMEPVAGATTSNPSQGRATSSPTASVGRSPATHVQTSKSSSADDSDLDSRASPHQKTSHKRKTFGSDDEVEIVAGTSASQTNIGTKNPSGHKGKTRKR
ncbi:hypothetical protein DL96DRAFT_1797537 [Flagelloscypha sp. PMI_526]|nr:hypothetical protein DL96DRAFT_1797537 [Flagelloscypha sp. PMI_526]